MTGPRAPLEHPLTRAGEASASAALAANPSPELVAALAWVLGLHQADTHLRIAVRDSSGRMSRLQLEVQADATLEGLAARLGADSAQEAPHALLDFGSGAPVTSAGLAIQVLPAGATVTLRAWCDGRTVDAWLAGRILIHFARVLGHRGPLADAQLLTDAEAAQLAAWNRTAVDDSNAASVHSLFEEQARARPEAVAVVSSEGQLTYAALDRRANQLAHHLIALGVTPGTFVGVCLERSLEVPVAVLGILKAGGAYLPLDPAYPKERLAFMLSDTQAPVVVTRASLAGALPQHAGQVVLLDRAGPALAALPQGSPGRAGSSADLAYVMYTSGSTGTPKGVEVVHRAITRLVRSVTYASLTADSCLLHAAPLAFDASTFELWGAWLNGGRCVVHPEALPTARGLGESIRTHGVTTVWLTAALFNAVIDDDASQLRGVRELLTGGEALSVDHVRRALTALPDTQLINGYGPTESTTFTTCYRIPRPLPEGARSIPIGGPIRDTTLHVLDARLRPAPLGAAGELCIGGEGLARGYHKRPELTAERFVTVAGMGRLYRTGDLVRLREDGALEFLGRRDEQVKLRGFRIELGEVEAAVKAHPAVQRCVVLAREDVPGQKRLVAYAVAVDGVAAPTRRVMKEFLERTLPAHMVPSELMWLPTLPITTNGKVDKRALPAPRAERPDLGVDAVPASTPLEQSILDVFGEVLGLTGLGVRDSFFEVGGTSLLALRAATLLQRAGLTVQVTRLFQHTTAEALARALTPAQPSGAASPQHSSQSAVGAPPPGAFVGPATAGQVALQFGATLGQPTAGQAALQFGASLGQPTAAQQPGVSVGQPTGNAAPQSGQPGEGQAAAQRNSAAAFAARRGRDIAVVGMSGRFPGADTVEALWANLKAGVDSIRSFTDAELDASIPTEQRADPGYVKARGVVEGCELFDAAFFGISPKEAEAMDPQQRLLLEVCWEALERSGHVPDTFPGAIGLFAGKYFDFYWDENVRHHPEVFAALGDLNTRIANDKHFVATRVAHRLNLTGPAISVHSACSTSLVAICQAVQSLRSGESDLALAGGASITVPVRSGYVYQEGSMLSPDGHTRSFDAQASGTTFSDGVAVVVLRRLEDALADGDTIHAVIRGAAINNDGARRASFTAPSVEGQSAVVLRALADAGVEPRSISYVEAHGTATPLGDPIEVEALTRAYRTSTPDVGFCALGSVKSNVGHLVIAAGATGLIKTSLSLSEKTLVPTAHFTAPNPGIDFASSPFHVQAALEPWPQGPTPRRAGVSSFGVGGTNAHVVLEEAPEAPAPAPSTQRQLLVLSARTPAALEAATARLRAQLEAQPTANLADVAFTLQEGRQPFAQRRFLVCTPGDAVAGLAPGSKRLVSAKHAGRAPGVVFMFPGQGSQHVDMGRTLYREEPVFRAAVDRCAAALLPELGRDLREALYPAGDAGAAADVLRQTAITQPALFTISFALASLWQSWGVKPVAMIGHSVGEFVCAALAGVLSVEDAARLVAARGRLMQGLPAGSMLSVSLSNEALAQRLARYPTLAVASQNAPQLAVVSGPTADVAALQQELEAAEVGCRALLTSHAFHSPMMDPVVEPFAALVRRVSLQPPRIPFVSTVTGTWITPQQATDPLYWARHLRETVRFADGVATLLQDPNHVLLEAGPRATLTAMARRQVKDVSKQPLVASQSDTSEGGADQAALLSAAGQLWLSGVPLDWAAVHQGQRRTRVVLPTYPFERKRFWLEAPKAAAAVALLGGPAAAQVQGGVEDAKVLSGGRGGPASAGQLQVGSGAAAGVASAASRDASSAQAQGAPGASFASAAQSAGAGPGATFGAAAQSAGAAPGASFASAARAQSAAGASEATFGAAVQARGVGAAPAASFAAAASAWAAATNAAAFGGGAPTSPASAAGPSAANVQAPSSSASLPSSSPTPLEQPMSVQNTGARLSALKEMFEEVTGLELADADPSASFVDLGLDSLFLTQAALQVQKRFGVKVTFRQLMESFTSLEALAAHLDSKLPPEAAPVTAAPVPAAPAPVAAPIAAAAPMAMPMQAMSFGLPAQVAGGSVLQQVIDQQLRLMATQLAMLSGGGMVAMPAPVAVAAPAATQAQASNGAAVNGAAAHAATNGAAVNGAATHGASPAAAEDAGLPIPAAAAAKTTIGALEDLGPNGQNKYDVKKAFGAIAKITTHHTELTPKQRSRLDALARRYNTRTKESKRRTQANRMVLADPRVVTGFKPMTKEMVYQIIVERSKGSHLWDVDGNEYVDALCGFGSCFFGWQPDFVTEAVKKQLELGHEIGPMSPLAAEVAKLLCEMVGFDRAGFCNTGSEAVMGSMRVARTVTGRSTIVTFTGAYHGIFDEVIVRGTKKLKAIPAAPGILPNTSQNVLVLDYGTPESLEIIRSRADELAAVLVEPVQSRRPDFRPREFLHAVRDITEKAGAALIFDEVVNGFRTGPGGAQEYFGIKADLASYGKVVGGGFPIGIIAGRKQWADALDGGFWQYGDDSVPTVGVTYFAGTFCRHPLALAACRAVLEHLKAAGPGLQQAMTAKTEKLIAELNAHFLAVKAPIVMKGFASLWRATFTDDQPLNDLLFVYLRDRGVHIMEGFPCFLTTAHSDADIAFIIKAFKDSVAEMQEAGFFPEAPQAPAAADANAPPVPGARLGRDPSGVPTWYVPDPAAPGKYLPLERKS